MTRLTHALAAFTLAVGGTALVACGRPTPGEMPRLAPRPDPIDPSGSPPGPGLGALDPAPPVGRGPAAPVESTRGRVAQPVAQIVPMPTFQPDHAPTSTPADAGHEVEPPTNVQGGPADAGVKDSYSPPLPAVPDAHLPDSRLEPSGEPMPAGHPPIERMPG